MCHANQASVPVHTKETFGESAGRSGAFRESK